MKASMYVLLGLFLGILIGLGITQHTKEQFFYDTVKHYALRQLEIRDSIELRYREVHDPSTDMELCDMEYVAWGVRNVCY